MLQTFLAESEYFAVTEITLTIHWSETWIYEGTTCLVHKLSFSTYHVVHTIRNGETPSHFSTSNTILLIPYRWIRSLENDAWAVVSTCVRLLKKKKQFTWRVWTYLRYRQSYNQSSRIIVSELYPEIETEYYFLLKLSGI